MQHAADTGHSFRKTDVSVLDKDANWKSRGIRESIYIRALNPSLNRRSDRNDRYTLPSTYDSILKAAIKTPPTPAPHGKNERKTYTGDRLPGRQRLTSENAAIGETNSQPIPHIPHPMTTRRRARASEGAEGTT